MIVFLFLFCAALLLIVLTEGIEIVYSKILRQ